MIYVAAVILLVFIKYCHWLDRQDIVPIGIGKQEKSGSSSVSVKVLGPREQIWGRFRVLNRWH